MGETRVIVASNARDDDAAAKIATAVVARNFIVMTLPRCQTSIDQITWVVNWMESSGLPAWTARRPQVTAPSRG